MHGDFKDHGFGLETTHLRNPNPIDQFEALALVAYIWREVCQEWSETLE